MCGHVFVIICLCVSAPLSSWYLVVDSIEVGVEALVVPPPRMGDLSTDVACVWGAEALLVVVPAERVLHSAAEPRHVEAVLVLLILYAA